MPWVRDGGARVYRLPGVYRRLLESKCRFETQPDPRDWLVHEDRDELARAKVDAAERAAAMFEEQLQAGEPFTVAGWRVDGRKGGPDWLRKPAIYGGASSVRIYADDRVEPATFYGDRLADGTWEEIPADALG